MVREAITKNGERFAVLRAIVPSYYTKLQARHVCPASRAG